MTRVQYFHGAAFFPLLVPLVLAPLWLGLELHGVPLPSWLVNGVVFLFDAVLLFGTPYAVVVLLVLVILRGRPAKTYARVVAIVPVLFTLTLLVFFTLSGFDVTTALDLAWFYAWYGLIVGYFYVALTFAVLWVCERFHVV